MNTVQRTNEPALQAPAGTRRVVVFAGGGSGGHISPGLAIAERLVELDPSARCHFICSQRAIDEAMLRRAGAAFTPVPASPPSLRPAAAVRFLLNFRASRAAARDLMQREGATDVIALGGFVAAPVVSAARALGLPVLMTNLDDPPGRANRWMAPRCTRVVTAIDLPDRPGFAERVVGMPVRRCAIADQPPEECRERLGLDPGRLTLLVTGASQGSTSLNRFVTALAASDPQAFDGWQVYHLAGQGVDDEVRSAYRAAGVPAVVGPFQHEMGLAWGAASMAVSRAGASSVAEVAINAVPCLFLPYPHHADRHQHRNAQPLVASGGAAIADDLVDPGANLTHAGSRLRALLTDAPRREAMRAALSGRRPPDAAAAIASLVRQGIA